MSLSSWLSSIGLALNAVGAFIMLRWPFAMTLICFDPEDKKGASDRDRSTFRGHWTKALHRVH
jgi:hypothetical protein